MNQVMQDKAEEDTVNHFAVIGLVISLLALSLSVTTPWILTELSPPAPLLEDVAIEKAMSIKDKIIAAAKGEEYKTVQSPIAPKHWTDYWSLIVISISVCGVILGTVGFVAAKDRWLGGTAIGFGLVAIVAQYAIIALAVFILIFFIGTILNSIGLDL